MHTLALVHTLAPVHTLPCVHTHTSFFTSFQDFLWHLAKIQASPARLYWVWPHPPPALSWTSIPPAHSLPATPDPGSCNAPHEGLSPCQNAAALALARWLPGASHEPCLGDPLCRLSQSRPEAAPAHVLTPPPHLPLCRHAHTDFLLCPPEAVGFSGATQRRWLTCLGLGRVIPQQKGAGEGINDNRQRETEAQSMWVCPDFTGGLASDCPAGLKLRRLHR